MPAATLAWAVPSALGAIGLMQNGQQAKKANALQNKAIDAGKYTGLAQKAAYDIAQGYNPAKENQAAIDYANQSAGTQLQTNLKSLRSDFMLGGGQPTGDTLFNVKAQDRADRTLDPLRQFAAQLKSGETMQKLQAYAPAMGAPVGQLASNYFQAAQNAAPNWGPSINLFADAIKNIPGRSSQPVTTPGNPGNTAARF